MTAILGNRHSFPRQAIDYGLSEAELEPEQIDYVETRCKTEAALVARK